MQIELVPHPAASNLPSLTVACDVARLVDGRLTFVFMAVGEIARLRIPSAREPARRDGLWRHTCFEAFVKPLGGDAYFELNFAPSGEWAAYRFDGYRRGMAAAEVEPPTIQTSVEASHLSLIASIDLGPIGELVPWEDWRVGLSAVIEAEDGTISHWAMAHAPGAPDFHDESCFQGQLAPAATL
jgi:hypothetical protein